MKKFSFNLENKNVLITGGSGFLGSQIVEAFLREDANVFIIDLKKPSKKTSALFFKSNILNEKNLLKILSYFKKKKNTIRCFNKQCSY